MDATVSSIKRFLGRTTCVIDNAVFRLHYKATSVLLLVFSIVVTSKQYIGDPIDCISRDDIPNKILDTFCWIHATFSLPSAWNKSMGEEIPYPGVDKFVDGEKRVYHLYYQWVCFFLFLQCLMFFAPHYIWKICEGDYIRQLSVDLVCPILQEEKKKNRKRLLAQYLVISLGHHDFYAFKHFLCELCNFSNVIGQIFLTDVFLGGEFIRYGINVVQFDNWDPSVTYDPMIKVFPRLTKCTFRKFGSSGSVQRHDALCILPINIINEKIYLFIWFWFALLTVVSFLAVLYRIALILLPRVRYYTLRKRARLVKREHFNIVLGRCGIGDWFLLYLLCKNMDALHFRDVMAEITRNLDKIHKHEVNPITFDKSHRYSKE